MTNRLALILACLLIGGLMLDTAMGWGATLFLLRKLDSAIEWIAFWR